MAEQTLKLSNIRVNKKEFHMSKQPIDLVSVNVNQIVIFDKFKHSEEGYKYYIGYKENEIVKPFCIILPQMSEYIKYFKNKVKNNGKNMSFLIKDDKVQEKYKEIWGVIKNKLGIKFHSLLVYDKKHLKTKVREYSGIIKTNFLGNGMPKENIYYTCIASLLLILL